jgi:hypothetical protein
VIDFDGLSRPSTFSFFHPLVCLIVC